MISLLLALFIFEIILLSFFYFLILKVFYPATTSQRKEPSQEKLGLSIVISARNEEENIIPLLNTISAADYPADRYEIIIVDDYSDDGTKILLEQLRSAYQNFRYFSNNSIPGKRNSLSTGISNATFNHILITDADCRISPGWMNSYANLFESGCGFIFGDAPFIQEKSLTNKISCYENMKTHTLSRISLSIGIPHSASARNLGFSKSAFEKCGGYQNTVETTSGDDDLLLREMAKQKIKIAYLKQADAAVYSYTKNKIIDYIRQRARHTTTSFHYPLKVRTFLILWHIPLICFQFAFLLGFLHPIFIFMTILKMIFEFLSSEKVLNPFYRFSLVDRCILPFIYEAFLILNLFTSKIMKPGWK